MVLNFKMESRDRGHAHFGGNLLSIG